MRFYFYVIAVLSLMAAPLHAQFGQPAEPMVDAKPDEVAVIIDGEPVTVEDVTSYSAELQEWQGAGWNSAGELLSDYVFTTLASDLVLSGTTHKEEELSIPGEYPVMAQRQYLKRKYGAHMWKNIELPRDVMEEWFEQNRDTYTQPEKVHAFHIFMETSNDDASSSPEKVRAKLADVKKQADAGTSFSQLAKENSEAASADTGGEIGQLHRRMPVGPQGRPINLMLEEALFELQPGATSDILETTFGMHLLHAADRSPTVTATLDDLLTSNILPDAAKPNYVNEEMARLVRQHQEKLDGQIAPFEDELTTNTPAFTLKGETYTIHHLEQLYGPRFTRAYTQAKETSGALTELMQQLLTEEVSVDLAAETVGVSEDDKRLIKRLKDRVTALNSLRAILVEHFTVSDDQLQEAYEDHKNQFRKPEVAGVVVQVVPTETSATAEQIRNKEKARQAAVQMKELLAGGKKLEEVLAEVTGEEFTATGTVVSRHVVGNTTDTMATALDQLVNVQDSEGSGWVGPIQYTGKLTFGAIKERHAGEPAPFEEVSRQLQGRLMQINQSRARFEMLDELVRKGKLKWGPAAPKFFLDEKPASLTNE